MEMIDRLCSIELFADLNREQLAWLAKVGRPVELADGEVLFEDGDPAEFFYVLLDGELLITKIVGGYEQVLTRHMARISACGQSDDKPRAAHQYTGELPLLAGGGYVAKATAVGHTELLAYDKQTFLDMLVRCPQICRVLLPVLAWRIHSYEAHAGRRVMLEGLGTLAAGLAHELNNPAAAVVRTAGELRCAVRDLTDWAMRWGQLATPAEQRLLAETCEQLTNGGGAQRPDNALDAIEVTDMVVDLLAERGVESADETGIILADHGLDADRLVELADSVRPEVLETAVGCLSLTLNARTLVGEVAEAGQRVEALVSSTKAYTNLDRAPERDVDVREGLEATLAMQAPKLAGITIRRDYADLSPITAYPSELNQVWTNLIDNAVDAMNGRGELRISTRQEGDCAVVEIGDSGHGIPPDVLPLLFQPFYTTKDVGKGTGLGLHLSRDIVTHRHSGSIEATSVPGDTRFTVRLPLGYRRSSAATDNPPIVADASFQPGSLTDSTADSDSERVLNVSQ